MNFLKYNITVNEYTSSQVIDIIENCNGITITNTGDATATVKGITLYAGTPGSILGDSITIGGNQGEIISDKRLPLTFGAGAAPSITIIQKYYT